MSAMSCVLMGNASLTIGCGTAWREAGHAIRAVISEDAAVRDWAKSEGLAVLSTPEALHGMAGETRFDWLLSVAYLEMVPVDVLRLAGKGAVNFHDGPLPGYAGLNTPVWAKLAGEARHGITWHRMDAGIDTGAVLLERDFEIAAEDTAHTLNTKAYAAGLDSFGEVIGLLASGQSDGVAQRDGARRLCLRNDRPRGGGCVDFAEPREAVLRLVRGLDFDSYWNPLCRAKLVSETGVLLIGEAEAVAAPSTAQSAAPGEIMEVTRDGVTVMAQDGPVRLGRLTDHRGMAAEPERLFAPGVLLPVGEALVPEQWDNAAKALAPQEAAWRRRLGQMAGLTLPLVKRGGGAARYKRIARTLPEALTCREMHAAAAIWALMSSGQNADQAAGDIAWHGGALAKFDGAPQGAVCPWVPVRVGQAARDWADLCNIMATETQAADRAVGFAADLLARDPELFAREMPQIGLSISDRPIPEMAVTLFVKDGQAALYIDRTRVDAAMAAVLLRRLEAICARVAEGETRLEALRALPERELRRLLTGWNATQSTYDDSQTMHGAIEAQMVKTPEAEALVFEDQSLSYGALDLASRRVAAELRKAGIGPGSNVALCLPRGFDLVIGALGILRAGGAYLPLDPDYPKERLAHCISDSGAGVIVTNAALAAQLPASEAKVFMISDLATRGDDGPVDGQSGPGDLAYLIYTSGSTGLPKGVMVEHRNVVNFFHAMDRFIDRERGRNWMAVTSLAFDISVLELFYTLSRGFRVVISGDETRAAISNGPLRGAAGAGQGAMDFSLYYWGADDQPGPGKYDLLMKGARYADENGFAAIWTPERHFHAFGGPYPNPAVTGASVAGFTSNIGVRAGSIVAPLHHPARIAEEWAVIDNLTGGRAGMAFASGWQPDDFILRPENTPPKNREALFETLEQVRALWRGETVEFPRDTGEMHGVVTQPRPVSSELAVWVTTAGNPETWREAGANGANILTHLLGQSIDEVAEKIALYHAALRDAGHDPAAHKVTLMLHSYLAEDRETARAIAREPMKDYLRSAAGLIKQYAWAFPAFKKPEGVTNPFQIDLSGLSEDEMEAILDFAFERYFEDSGFFGSVEDAIKRAEALREIGVSEIACLIEYGIETETVLESLPRIKAVMDHVNADLGPAADDFSLAAQIVRHEITHLQATPSMARLFMMNDEAREALTGVKQIYLGGEALPGSLVAELREVTGAEIHNMYGPTETTIWSTVAKPGAPVAGAEPIGRPIANTVVRVLDEAGGICPVGVPGELWIGGDGVTRGYWQREALTAERFCPDPHGEGEARLYRTGDLVCWRADGQIEFLGRTDFQVKIRGQRIELGEIESALKGCEGVSEAVVVAREIAGDTRLVAYYTGAEQDEAALKSALATRLVGAMVPAHVRHLVEFPLTPNKKINRKALPDPVHARPASAGSKPVAVAEPAPAPVTAAADVDKNAVQEAVLAVWREVLGVSDVGPADNFFDLGGHSLLAVQAHRQIRAALPGVALSITDVFRFPVLQDLVAHVAAKGGAVSPTAKAAAPKQTESQPVAVVEAARRVLAPQVQDIVTRRQALRAKRKAEQA